MAKKIRTLKPIKINRKYLRAYKKLLVSYSKKTNLIIGNNLFSFLKRVQSKYQRNDDELFSVFDKIEIELIDLFDNYSPLIVRLLTRMKNDDKDRFYKSVQDQLSISLKNILEKENIQNSFSLAIKQNLELIKSLTAKQLSRVKNVVLSDLRAGEYKASTIKKMIEQDFGINERHAEFIARDQTHKMTSNLNQLRYENLGVSNYIWRTVEDERVRGNPSGKYPNARPSHYAREGKTFSFKKPPEGGNPGEDYNCRCVAEPILPKEYDNL